ncbi:MAG: RDD family protein [Niabella sp.]|nr:RDD family protein [Niabella sp.]
MYPEQTAAPEFSLFEDHFEYTRASTGKRLANYIIDLIVFYVFMFLLGVVLALLLTPEVIYSMDENGWTLLDRLLILILYALYMGTMEAIFRGRSVGKFITRTKAVNLDGTPISAGTAFLRGLSRAVPFCLFSAFGTPCDPWQDRWTKTMVIDQNTGAVIVNEEVL